MDGAKLRAVDAEIDKVLAPIKGKYDEGDYAELRAGVLKDLTAKIRADQDWFANHLQEYADLKAEFQYCWKNGQDPASLNPKVQFYINDLLVRARRMLPSIAAPRIQKATSLKVAAAQPKNATARPRTHQPYNVREDPDFARMFMV